MKKKKILSISIAAYNVETMIEQCITSFIDKEIIEDVELIITDDGAKDKTMEIAEKYAKLYPDSIKLVYKQNEGPGSTVNSGIKNATGKYFRMVDGDDWVNTENFCDLVKYLKTCEDDMVVCDYDIFDNNDKKIIETKTLQIEPNKSLLINEIYNLLPAEMHATVYKLEKYKKSKVVLDNCFYTDVEYQLFPIPFVDTVSYFNKSIYVYRVARAGQSVSPESRIRNIAQHERVLKRLINYYLENKKSLSIGQSLYMIKRLDLMIGAHIEIFCLMERNKENKNKLKEFVEYCYNQCPECCKGKKIVLLKKSNYILYGLVRFLCRRRMNKNA